MSGACTSKRILALATSYLGVKESPAGSNNVDFNTRYYGKPVSGSDFPWCCAFVYCMFEELNALDLFCGGQKTAWCPYVESYAIKSGQWITKDFQPGDCVLFNFQGGTLAGHIGFCEHVNADGTLTCIEGNTSIDSDDNGGCVMHRTRYTKNILGAFRPNYADNSTESEDDDMIDFDNLTDEQVDKLMARINMRLAVLPVSEYAKESGAKAVKSGLFSDGDNDKMVDDPRGLMLRQDLAVVMNRAGLLDK